MKYFILYWFLLDALLLTFSKRYRHHRAHWLLKDEYADLKLKKEVNQWRKE